MLKRNQQRDYGDEKREHAHRYTHRPFHSSNLTR